MSRREVARTVAVGLRNGERCSVVVVRWEDRSVTVYPYGVESYQVVLPAAEWAKLVELPEVA